MDFLSDLFSALGLGFIIYLLASIIGTGSHKLFFMLAPPIVEFFDARPNLAEAVYIACAVIGGLFLAFTL